MKRHEQREIALNSLYQHLLLNKDIRKCVYEAMHGTNEIDGYLYSITVDTVAHEYNYIQTINHLLRKDWTFNRLSVLEQAILLMACQEILVNQTPKAVVIDEAVGLAKKYCDDDSYKLINGVLDQL
ncbi:MAG: transcription antitermination factor NusB [Absicoccus porci]|uniref:transcription antitermination factor NusB n=1 Tax=Absicoccus porci TaxID=2486576 RepID=UPI0023563688|nr:transcription antitermination factor NusB [Absicoccus porci]MCI6088532.1 transcription antitermination factor NusB [Absicoccus porci]MDD7330217.1 transcription antitermination factor NusB [Absicoccus porci]MDY4739485.1 transcription antitermination factor NusB [Absicoccus porci]